MFLGHENNEEVQMSIEKHIPYNRNTAITIVLPLNCANVLRQMVLSGRFRDCKAALSYLILEYKEEMSRDSLAERAVKISESGKMGILKLEVKDLKVQNQELQKSRDYYKKLHERIAKKLQSIVNIAQDVIDDSYDGSV